MFITEECKIPEKKHNACASQRMSTIQGVPGGM